VLGDTANEQAHLVEIVSAPSDLHEQLPFLLGEALWQGSLRPLLLAIWRRLVLVVGVLSGR
jgi:hypothetical protein